MLADKILVVAAALAGVAIMACSGHHRSTEVSADSSPSVAEKAAPGPVVKVVLNVLQASGAAENEVAGISSRLCTELSQSKKIELVCAEDLKQIFALKESMLMFGSCNDEDCLAKMGSQLEADFIIHGAINQVGETLVFNLNLADGKTGKVKSRQSEEVPAGAPEKLLDASVKLAKKILAEL